jgi:hypothetical protein
VAKVEIGQEVTVLVDALPDETLIGAITYIVQINDLVQSDVV